MEDNFEYYSIVIESDVLSCDFDNIDLYGDKIEEESGDTFSDNIEYE